MPKELDHPRKGSINILNTDNNKCFKWCLVRYWNPADYNPRSITKTDQDFTKRLDLTDMKFPVKIRDIYNFQQKNSIGISVLLWR